MDSICPREAATSRGSPRSPASSAALSMSAKAMTTLRRMAQNTEFEKRS